VISTYDYFIIAFYLAFILGVGFIFRRMSKNTSDYFRAGGAMPWWITGASSWVASFSAWTFTGAAGMIYETGTVVLCLYYSAVVGMLITFAWTCLRFRRMRVVSWMEAVRLRYGGGSEQFYFWVKLPLVLFGAGVSLNAIGVFISSIFHVDMVTTLIVLGVVVTVVTFAGGAWAILASDFVQMFLVVTITLLAAFLTLRLPEIGGISGLIEKVNVPLAPTHWTQLAQGFAIIPWIVAITWMQIINTNNMENSTMYLMARSDRDARRMVLIPIIGSLISPFIWIVPPLAATILHPNLGAEFPNLKQPHEAAFVAMCLQVMPQGLMGLLISAMLGATLTSMDAGLNKGVGVFVRSFYLPIINPNCPEKRLLIVSKMCTVAFGFIIISLALMVNQWRTVNLFDFVNQMSASLSIPLAIPLCFGLFFKRTPGWSAWSTGLVGFAVSFFINFWLGDHFQDFVGQVTPRERTYLLLATTTFGTLFVAGGWFFLTSLFYPSSPVDHRERVEDFFQRLRTPVQKEGIEDLQEKIYRLLGLLCLIYGAFILFLTLIPNSLTGRMCFVFCGGTIFVTGASLYLISRRIEKRIEEHPPIVDPAEERMLPHPPTSPATRLSD
jgi:SSS family solute:Na+ symporter